MASSKLLEIIEHKATEVARLRPHAETLRKMALERNDFRSFKLALDREGARLGLIAEVKKASPSAGVIAEDFDPVGIAREYVWAGADAISVLTDEKYFQGSLEYLRDIRPEVPVPLLRKDFIIDPLQVYEAVVAGADAILLIVAGLEQAKLKELHALATACQLDVLTEVHTLGELDRALDAGAEIIGINNRNLATFEVDLETTLEISEEVPEGMMLVSESGIKSAADTRQLVSAGVDAILVGETLMRAPDRRSMAMELVEVMADVEE